MSRRITNDPDQKNVGTNVAVNEAKTANAAVTNDKENDGGVDMDPGYKLALGQAAEINKTKESVEGQRQGLKKIKKFIDDLKREFEEFKETTERTFSLVKLKLEKLTNDTSVLKSEIQRIQNEKKSVSSSEIDNLKKENESLRNEINELKKSVEEIRKSSGGALSDLEMADAERGRLVSGYIVTWKENGVEKQKIYESEMDAEILANSLDGTASKLKWAFVDDKNFVISIPTAKQLEKLGKL